MLTRTSKVANLGLKQARPERCEHGDPELDRQQVPRENRAEEVEGEVTVISREDFRIHTRFRVGPVHIRVSSSRWPITCFHAI